MAILTPVALVLYRTRADELLDDATERLRQALLLQPVTVEVWAFMTISLLLKQNSNGRLAFWERRGDDCVRPGRDETDSRPRQSRSRYAPAG